MAKKTTANIGTKMDSFSKMSPEDLEKLRQAKTAIPEKIDLANVKEMPTKFDLGSGKAPDLTETINAANRSKTIDVASKFKPEAADWIKKLQQGGGKDMLSNLIDPDDIAGSLAFLMQRGQGILEPLLNYNKPSDFEFYG